MEQAVKLESGEAAKLESDGGGIDAINRELGGWGSCEASADAPPAPPTHVIASTHVQAPQGTLFVPSIPLPLHPSSPSLPNHERKFLRCAFCLARSKSSSWRPKERPSSVSNLFAWLTFCGLKAAGEKKKKTSRNSW